jgi:hypothetical protein
MKKMIGNKPIGVIIHIYIEILQGNSLWSYLYLKQGKMTHFLFISSLFFFYKIREEEGGPVQVEGVGLRGLAPVELGRR